MSTPYYIKLLYQVFNHIFNCGKNKFSNERLFSQTFAVFVLTKQPKSIFCCLAYIPRTPTSQNYKKSKLRKNTNSVYKYLRGCLLVRMRRSLDSRRCWAHTAAASPCPAHRGNTPDNPRGRGGTVDPELHHKASEKTQHRSMPKTVLTQDIRNESSSSFLVRCDERTHDRLIRGFSSK